MSDTETLDEQQLKEVLSQKNDDIQQVYSWITNSDYKDYVNRIMGDE